MKLPAPFSFHLLSWPLIGVFAYGSAMSAFSPGANPPKRTHWSASPPTPFELVWSGGYLIAASVVDRVFFGGPLPPAPINPDFGDPQVYAKLEQIGARYWPEYNRRKAAYAFCWVFNTVFFAVAVGGAFVLFTRPFRT
jgi:hypothetical protein